MSLCFHGCLYVNTDSTDKSVFRTWTEVFSLYSSGHTVQFFGRCSLTWHTLDLPILSQKCTGIPAWHKCWGKTWVFCSVILFKWNVALKSSFVLLRTSMSTKVQCSRVSAIIGSTLKLPYWFNHWLKFWECSPCEVKLMPTRNKSDSSPLDI